MSAEIAEIGARVGEVYGLDLYGVDVLLGPDGPVVVDVNDFPSFRQVPDAAARVARAVLGLARGAGSRPGAGVAAALPLRPGQAMSIPLQATAATAAAAAATAGAVAVVTPPASPAGEPV